MTDPNDGDAYVLSIPTGALVETLTGLGQPLGDCSDSNGDVFIVDTQGGDIREFRYGDPTTVNTLDDHDYYPNGCAVDPTTGNLAVTNYFPRGNGSPPGNVAIYAGGRGSPRYYSDAKIFGYGFCTYDSRGTLYISGFSRPNNTPQIAELPKHGTAFLNITTKPSLGGTNIFALQWDGKYLAVGSQTGSFIYRFAIKGTEARLVATTNLTDYIYALPFWIQGKNLYAPQIKNSIGAVGVYGYPAGGKPSQVYYSVVTPFAVTVSQPPGSSQRSR